MKINKEKGELVLDATKLPYHPERIKQWLNGKKIAPITVEWALTPKCTYQCVFDNYCYTTKERNSKRELSEEAAFNFIDDAAEIGVKAIPLGSDGESTCSPFLYDIIPYAKKKGLDIAMSTNGFLLKDNKLDKILPHLTYLRFNIAAGNPKRYSEIMGCYEKCFYKVAETIKESVKIKKEKELGVTIGLQMVLMPQFEDQIIPLSKFGKKLGVDFLVIKHCDESSTRSLGVDYHKYKELVPILKEAENFSGDEYSVKIKWSKILSEGKHHYKRCYGPQFLTQIFGSGDIAPCGASIDEHNKNLIIGNIIDTRFKDIWNSNRWMEVMNSISSNKFNHEFCGPLCFQHKVNECLWDLKKGKTSLDECLIKKEPLHVNFI